MQKECSCVRAMDPFLRRRNTGTPDNLQDYTVLRFRGVWGCVEIWGISRYWVDFVLSVYIRFRGQGGGFWGHGFLQRLLLSSGGICISSSCGAGLYVKAAQRTYVIAPCNTEGKFILWILKTLHDLNILHYHYSQGLGYLRSCRIFRVHGSSSKQPW